MATSTNAIIAVIIVVSIDRSSIVVDLRFDKMQQPHQLK